MDLTTKVFSILPQVKEIAFIKELFQIIGYYSDDFLKNRTKSYLLKIAKTQWEIKAHLEQSISTERQVYFKLFAVKFANPDKDRKVLGILFALNFLSQHEQFKKSHLLNTLRMLVPGSSILEDSFFMMVDERTNHLICYCEIEKSKGKNLSFEETFQLKKLLSQEIKDNIGLCSPELWAPENIEQTLKDAIVLQQQVTNAHDFPHVSISFKELGAHSISFIVIIVRIVKKDTPSLQKKLLDFWPEAEIELEKTGPFLEGYTKETVVLSLKMLNSLFYRKNYTVDLLKARQYICMSLEQMIGEFRDYNGGLLLKQTEQFNSFISHISNKIEGLSDFESLFYSLSPSNIQLLIPTNVVLEISKVFYNLQEDSTKRPFHISFKKLNQVLFIIIKTESSIYDSVFAKVPKSSLMAKSSKKIGQYTYHFLVQINALDFSVLESVQTRLDFLQKQTKSLFSKEVRINFQEGAPTSFHPHLNGDVKTFTVCKALYDGLVRLDPKGKIKPSIAKRIDISPCKTKFTFTLRECKWTNGMEVTSYDFARAWEKAVFARKNGRNPTGSRHLFLIKHAEEVINGELPVEQLGIETPDQQTLIVELKCPHPFFLHLLATTTFSPLHGYNLDKEPTVFNGPFIPTVYSNDRIELRKNQYYWDAKSVHLEKITISFHKDPKYTYNLFKQGKLDWIGSPFNSLPEQGLEQIQTYQADCPFWFFCNTQHPKLKSLKIRRALYLSIDREKLTKDELFLQKPLYGIIPDRLSAINAKKLFPKDPIREARLLFDQGLEEVGYTKKEFSLAISHSDVPSHKKIACFTKKCWELALGIKVKLIEIPWNSYNRNLVSSNFEIGGANVTGEYKSGLFFLNLFSSRYSNFPRWEKKEYTKIFSKGAFSKKLLKYAEEILMKEFPAIPVSNPANSFFMGDLKNLIFPEFAYSDFKWVIK